MTTTYASTTGILTTHLLSLSTPRPYSAATQHPFLAAAGHGTLPSALLSFYLAQDRIFVAHGGIAFLGRLLAAVPFSSLDTADAPRERTNQRIVQVLSYSLQNVVREVAFFEETQKKFELRADDWYERKGTRDYMAEMVRVSANGSIMDGMVFLWAMERVYLDAWKYVKSLAAGGVSGESSAAIAELVANWTNPDFEKFVDELADLINSLRIEPGSEAWVRAEQIWARVIELEEAFWPVGGEEVTLLRS